MLVSGSGFPAPAGQVCERPVALTTVSLWTGPSGGAWPSTTPREGAASLHDDSSILPSPGQACGKREHQPRQHPMNPSPPYDLSIDLDRADQEADLGLIQSTTGQRRSASVDIDSSFSRRGGLSARRRPGRCGLRPVAFFKLVDTAQAPLYMPLVTPGCNCCASAHAPVNPTGRREWKGRHEEEAKKNNSVPERLGQTTSPQSGQPQASANRRTNQPGRRGGKHPGLCLSVHPRRRARRSV